MSFLSRKPARPDGRGRDDQYDDYDDYAHDGYQNEDEWSPGEYFSPEGIKGKWAGENPDGRSGGRGRQDSDRGGADYDAYGNDDFNGPDYGGSAGYGADEFATGVYDLPEGADGDRSDRNRRRRSRDREDRGERTGILRLRRDRGEDIWPDDGISDEDYWASVAADVPLNGTDAPLGNVPAANGAGARPGMDTRPGTDARFGGDQHGSERGGAGRLGPPPGLASDYKPGGAGSPGSAGPAGSTGPMGRPGQAGGSGRAASGPMPTHSGTSPRPVRPGTGPTPTVGVTSSRPPAGQGGTRPGPGQPGPGSGYPQPAPRPSFQPNGRQSSGLPGGAPAGRQQDRSDWGDRTERIERVNAAGYPEPQPAGRSQGLSSPGASRASGPLGPGASATPGLPGTNGAPERSRSDNAAWRAPERREPDRREPHRDGGREAAAFWPAPVPARSGPPARTGSDDDPLTSKAYSRSAMPETDGRSYRAAARRSQAQTKLTDQAEAFIAGQYQQPAQHQEGRTGEYWQYRDDAQAPTPQARAGRYPAPGGQGPGGQGPGGQGPGGQGGHPAQSGRAPAGPGQGPGQAGQPGRSSGRPGMPGPGSGSGSGLPGGQYEAQQQPRPSQQRQQPQQRQPQLPAAGNPAAGPAASDPAGTRPAGNGGLNPYDSGVTGSYPYPNQSYPARPAPARPARENTDDRYYRPAAQDGYDAGGTGQGRSDQGRSGYGNGYPASGDRRR
jgi:hypothetical protein